MHACRCSGTLRFRSPSLISHAYLPCSTTIPAALACPLATLFSASCSCAHCTCLVGVQLFPQELVGYEPARLRVLAAGGRLCVHDQMIGSRLQARTPMRCLLLCTPQTCDHGHGHRPISTLPLPPSSICVPAHVQACSALSIPAIPYQHAVATAKPSRRKSTATADRMVSTECQSVSPNLRAHHACMALKCSHGPFIDENVLV